MITLLLIFTLVAQGPGLAVTETGRPFPLRVYYTEFAAIDDARLELETEWAGVEEVVILNLTVDEGAEAQRPEIRDPRFVIQLGRLFPGMPSGVNRIEVSVRRADGLRALVNVGVNIQ